MNQFVKVPHAVMYNTELNDAQKITLSQIIALANTRNYCYANNFYLARLLNKSKVTISRIISALQSKGYIEVQLMKGERRIFINRKKLEAFDYEAYLSNMDIAMSENDKGSYQKRIGSLITNDKDNREYKREDNIEMKKSDRSDRFVLSLISRMDDLLEQYEDHSHFPSFFDPPSFFMNTNSFLKVVFDTYAVEPSSLYSSFLDCIYELPVKSENLDFFYKSFKDLLLMFLEELEANEQIKLLENPSTFDSTAPAYERFLIDSYTALLKLYNERVLKKDSITSDSLAI